MAILKPKKHGVHIDMTAMSDVNLLILTFFIMTATFKTVDPGKVQTPTSISETKVPEEDLMVISLNKDGHVFFGIDDKRKRIALLDIVTQAKGIHFTEKEKIAFSQMENFGMPISQLKPFLALSQESRASVSQSGIPLDSTGADPKNELKDWIYNARKANNGLRISVRGDNDADFPSFKNVLATLQAQNINKFSLITDPESAPAGWKAD
ncbi:biopolymer transporter ExbD [Dyadobacter luteus]|uniref:Biopolymer transporter ExbD n=1 Tax=Dyadobacter luteus TaxID=2259619 RepID=A0A3D8YAB7_9BACT|nr:biopolymer transporter ExbD [Dyadobacter luteus]REA60107.1 biopolymer transporter ExbD [Dyadobacter luteus]